MNKQTGVFLFGVLLATQVFSQDIQLPAPQKSGGMPLMDALNARQSNREFSPKPLSDQQLANLLWAAFGINRPDGKRTAPSAHNAQDMDLFVALPSGVYLYQAQSNALTQVVKDDLRAQIGKQPITKNAPVSLYYVSDTTRLKGNAALYSAVHAGFISQNVYLFCASEGLNTVVMGVSENSLLRTAAGLKPTQQIMLSQAVGFPPAPKR